MASLRRAKNLRDRDERSDPATTSARPSHFHPLPHATANPTAVPRTHRDVINLQRLVGNRATQAVIQRKAYTVTRSLPIETHFSLKPLPEAKMLILGKLRAAHPLSAEDDLAATTGEWSADERDAKRGPEFADRKKKALARLATAGTYPDPKDDVSEREDKKALKEMVYVPGAHVAGLSVVRERKRKEGNKLESAVTKNATGTNDWIGAHVVKREWGGEDNMWNVVCWPKAAEEKWGEEFEEPIEVAFTNQTKTKLNIAVSVDKEDEAVTAQDVDAWVAPNLVGKDGDANAPWRQAITSAAIAATALANRGLERIPKNATGTSPLGSSTLGPAETKWTEAVASAKANVKKKIDAQGKKAPHPSAKLKSADEATAEANATRMADADVGKEQELKNYRPERFEGTATSVKSKS